MKKGFGFIPAFRKFNMILAIDYGRVHMGLAISQSGIPSPLRVISTRSDQRKLEDIKQILTEYNIEGIVIGKGSGELGNHIRGFIQKIKKFTSIPITSIDETLTSNHALDYMIKNNVPVKKRKSLEHTYAACILLEEYYEQQN
ncbi:Holliday junction resolvase RuvX [Candidatus Gottesmanbacteria bacterium]|nr:Holliday junction resolvase RuvX [Candidatus Gottesmanbacteria bacterium]